MSHQTKLWLLSHNLHQRSAEVVLNVGVLRVSDYVRCTMQCSDKVGKKHCNCKFCLMITRNLRFVKILFIREIKNPKDMRFD
ncbi:hypothetical protein VNO78_30957 [Psophocarpus tetragonolobus]|uniref:Uncharacterized protein n=1 Tax=Psophocarpus tetragonolobus TaxID=3891 RepID=A0AAN9X657_PSOTE